MTKFIFIYVTCPSLKVAKQIANKAIENKTAACANILPAMQSIYRWQGRTHTDREVVLILKTTTNKFKANEKLIKATHPYECPCIVALPVAQGSKKYLEWLANF